jgi:methylthioribose-1-phosphate isomerase
MTVRGAPIIAVTAAYGAVLATESDDFHAALDALEHARPTAVNVQRAMKRIRRIAALPGTPSLRRRMLLEVAKAVELDELHACRRIGMYGKQILERGWKEKNRPLQILTHCNAGRLACVDYGTATAPIYLAPEIPVHVWVSETRPRNQGFSLTAWELSQKGVANTLIPDNAAGYLIRKGEVDMVIVGADRVTRNGDVVNKIGTYLKALAARESGIPFYVALPSATYDPNLSRGDETPIETRSEREVTHIWGYDDETDKMLEVRIVPDGAKALNYGFDVTPADLVTAYITDRGILNSERLEALSS